MTRWYDDLGHPVELSGPARRVVSLVPSLTEAVAVSAPGLLVGVTDWCSHPAGLDAVRVGGTKNPDVAGVIAPPPGLGVAHEGGKPGPHLARPPPPRRAALVPQGRSP